MTADVNREREAINQAMMELIQKRGGGIPARELVEQVTGETHASKSSVSEVLRTLLEKGDVEVGPKLNLVVPPETAS